MIKGSIPTDGGFLIIDEHEFNELNKDTVLKDFIKPFLELKSFERYQTLVFLSKRTGLSFIKR